MNYGQEFRTFAIEELGEEYREFSTDSILVLLETKAKREGWETNRNSYPAYGPSKALPPPQPRE